MPPIPERASAEWRRFDAAHLIHPFADPRAMAAGGGTRVITRGEGVYVFDSDGHRLLDGAAGLGCVALGYDRRELVEAAERQLRTLPYGSSFSHATTPPAIELARLLCERTPPGLDRVFFGCSGSESIDTIVRMIWRYWDLEDQPRKRILLSREHACHGSTVAGASLGGLPSMHAMSGVLAGVSHVMPPDAYRLGQGTTPEALGRRAADAIEERILALDPERVAAFFAEPVQAAGGVIVPPASYWPRVQEICRRYDVLLVADEVVCGFGRTGTWFGCERFEIRPDLMALAKAITSGYLPLSAAIVGERVARTLERRGGPLAHGYTHTGHPAACAVGAATIRILAEEQLVERTREETGPYLARCLREALAGHPLVGDVRGVGLLYAVELARDRTMNQAPAGEGELGRRCLAHCFDNGIALRAVRDTLSFCPPLVITRSEIDELVEKAKQSIDQTAREIGVM